MIQIIPSRMKLPTFMLGLAIIDSVGLLYKFAHIGLLYTEVGVGVGAVILFASIILP